MKKFLAIILFSALSLSTITYAHNGATGVVKQRMDMMGEVARAMKTIGQMMKGEVDYNSEQVKFAALEVKQHAENFQSLFIEGPIKNPSEALPIIWEQWEEFAQLFEEMETQSSKLAELAPTVSTADKIKAQFILVSKTCSTCHQKFRLKK